MSDRWTTKLHALIPRPGFPACAYVHPNGRVYVGTYTNPNGDTMRSRVFEYTGDGFLLRSWTMQGQILGKPHGVQVATSDKRGRLVLLDKSPPRVVFLDTRDGKQKTYAAFTGDAIPNYAAWGPDGSLYVTDYGQPVIWRIPRGGGKPVEWLRDPRLDGGEFGTTGIALRGDREALLVAIQSQAGLTSLTNPATGRLFTIPLDGGKPGQMKQLWESQAADGPDGFAIAESGNVYVTLLLSNQIAVVGPDGKERERFPSQKLSGANGSPVPFDSPSSAKFLGTRLMVAQQSYVAGDATHQAVLDVETGEKGLAEFIPR